MSTTNLQKLREHRGLSPEELEQKTGIAAATISDAESGKAELTAEESYELAVYFQTGTSDLLESQELATSTQVDFPGNEAYDGFWGHVGILLHGHRHTKWYPITTTAADAVWDDLQSHESGFIVVRTLNNRVLFVNPQQVKKIMLNDDDADAPPDFEDVATYMAPVCYEAIREWYLEGLGIGDISYGAGVKTLVESLLKEEKLDDAKLEEILLKTSIYYRDGSSENYQADSSHLGNIWSMGYNVSIPMVSIPERNDLFYCWYSGQSVALIDTPYLELEESRRGEKTTIADVKREERPVEKETAKRSKGKNGGKRGKDGEKGSK